MNAPERGATKPIRVNLFSDTQTRPTEAMRNVMAEAEVGDEQLGEDPTVNLLQDMVAEMLGKEASVFLPSGTMCNEISFAVHCRPGDEIVMHETAHPLTAEGGGPAALTGALIRSLSGERGIFSAGALEAAIRPPSRYSARTRAVSIEQTTNIAGGAIWPLDTMHEVCTVARAHGLVPHLDGARLFNAVVATGISAADYAASFESAWIDLSKGLGAPVGAVLTGTADFIDEAWRFKQRMGGAMRQAGIIAAAGVYALRHHLHGLEQDHANAATLARGLADLPGIALDPDLVETNIVIFDVAGTKMTADEFAARMLDDHGVRYSTIGPTSVRAVTHLDVSREDVEIALEGARTVLR
ncbi:MAG: threonine aldolase family protein [Actinomycetota bacterium]